MLVIEVICGVVGQVEKACNFDRVNDHIDDGTNFVSGNKMPISAWIHSDLSGSGDERIISKAIGFSGNQQHFALIKSGSSFNFRINTGSYSQLIGGNILPNTWTHAVGIYDGIDMILYQDGVKVSRTGNTGSIIDGPGVNVWLGDNPVSSNREYTRHIDELIIFDDALTLANIQTMASV
jgi:hypothetical protein